MTDNVWDTNLIPHIKYVKTSEIVEVIMYDGSNGERIKQWSEKPECVVESPVCEPTDNNPTGEYLQIYYEGKWHTAAVGDYIIKKAGVVFPLKQHIFEKSYSRVEVRRDLLFGS
jgi:hypothetical protein